MKLSPIDIELLRNGLSVPQSLAVLYAVGWGAIGLDYFVVLALLAGLLGFVPFVGPFFGVAMSVLVAIGQFGLDPTRIGLVLLVFVVVQIIEGSVLTPNLIGNRIGLHPVAVIFAVMAGGQLFGFVGVLVALLLPGGGWKTILLIVTAFTPLARVTPRRWRTRPSSSLNHAPSICKAISHPAVWSSLMQRIIVNRFERGMRNTTARQRNEVTEGKTSG